MRIVFYLSDFLPISQTFIFHQIEHLINLNHEIYIICLVNNCSFNYNFNVFNLSETKSNKYKLYLRLSSRGQYLLASQIFKKKFTRKILDIAPDLIICHFGNNAIDLYYYNFTKPIVVFFHGFDASKLPKNSSNYCKLILKINKLSNFKFLFVSNFLKNQIQKYIPEISGDVFHLGTLPKTINKKNITHVTKVVQVARLIEKKGLDISIKSILRLITHDGLDPEITFTILGNGPLKKDLEFEIVKNNLSNIIKIIPYLDHNDTISLIESCDIYLHPSTIASDGDSEGLCIAITEAMALNKFVITTKYSGICDILPLDHPGIKIVPDKCEVSIAEEIKNFISNRTKGINNNNKIIENNFNIYNQIKILENILFDLLRYN